MTGRKFLIVLLTLALLTVTFAPVSAQADDPLPTVQEFYTWYLDIAGYDEASGEFRNPLADGSYQERAELSPSLIEAVARIPDEEGGFFFDPFLCAQDVPESVSFTAIGSDAVLVTLFFAWNPRPHTLLAQLDAAGQIAAIECRETVTARGTVEAFYGGYAQFPPESDTTLLSDELEAVYTSDEPRGFDPFLCAQDIPQHMWVDEVVTGPDAATMIVRQYFAGNPQPHSISVDLAKAERWQITKITCEVGPETVAALLYNEFVRTMRYDMMQGIARTPIADWNPYPWSRHVGEALLDSLLAIYDSDEFRGVDPFICAQDLPEWVEVEPAADADHLRIAGMYPSGPDTFSRYNLATVEMALHSEDGWQMTAITCGG